MRQRPTTQRSTDRLVRTDSGYEELFVRDLSRLTPTELDGLPPGTRALFERGRLDRQVPAELGWARNKVGSTPVLARTTIDGRVHWSVRFTRSGDFQELAKPCFGADGIAVAGPLPAPLDWLASLGTCSFAVEQSGTAPWGRRLREYREGRKLLAFGADPPPELPEGSDEWVCLYEIDGDAIFADLVTGDAYWLGFEWTGEMLTRLEVGWRPAMHFVLWRLLECGYVRPSDLTMLAAARR